MFCPECQLVVGEESAACPACGGMLRDVRSADAVEVVEAMALLTDPTEAAADTSRAIVQVSERASLPALSRLAGLPALAWRQPAIRAAVRTGASAVALSLAVRAARAVMQSRRPSRALADGMLPVLSDLMQRRAGEYRAARDGQPVAVVETFIYVRRVVRRP